MKAFQASKAELHIGSCFRWFPDWLAQHALVKGDERQAKVARPAVDHVGRPDGCHSVRDRCDGARDAWVLGMLEEDQEVLPRFCCDE